MREIFERHYIGIIIFQTKYDLVHIIAFLQSKIILRLTFGKYYLYRLKSSAFELLFLTRLDCAL